MFRPLGIALARALFTGILLAACASRPDGERRVPYSIAARESPRGAATREYRPYYFLNESERTVESVLIAWEGYAGEERVSGEESLAFSCEPGSPAPFEIFVGEYARDAPEPVIVDTVTARRIRYSDGTDWADPFGAYAGTGAYSPADAFDRE